MKEERNSKIVLKNVYSSINLEELKQDINSKDHAVTNMKCVAKNYKGILIHVFYGIKISR